MKRYFVFLFVSYTFLHFCSFSQYQKNNKNVESVIDSILIEFNNDKTPGAAVLVLKNNKVLFCKGYGLANLESHERINEFTNFRLASISKQFTAMCIMILKERGKLKYENSITDIFPEFPDYGSRITIKHLLQHTSGLVDYEDMLADTVTIQVHDDDVLKMMASIDSTYFIPGSKYKYSNSGYAILAMIVEKVSGKRYANFLRDYIFKPLKMKNSVAYEKGISVIKNRAIGYYKKDNEFIERDQSSTSAVLGDGGIYCSLVDYKKWDNSLYTNKLVSQKTLDEAFSQAILNDGTSINYGFGWFINYVNGIKVLEHGGSTCGFTNYVIRIPERRITAIILTNRYGETKLSDYCKSIINLFEKIF